MMRSRWIVFAAALATTTMTGCAHHGLQDEMPAPCVAAGFADYGPVGAIMAPAVVQPPVVMPPATTTAPNSGPVAPRDPAIPDPLPPPGQGASPFSSTN